jgi:hypothetical protein
MNGLSVDCSPVGQVLINIDVGWDHDTQRAGIGIIGHDHLGSVLPSEWRYMAFCSSAEEAEAPTFLSGLHLLIKLNKTGFLGTDCRWVITATSSATRDGSPAWGIYMEMKELHSLNNDLVLHKVDRNSNRAAHSLAQLGKSGQNGFLCNSILDCIRELVATIVRTRCNLQCSRFFTHSFSYQNT